ncbi:MAG: CoA transferase [Saprospiraceae bacterium]|nr:CoA transferase [Saprospiraceae bacterium]
MSQHLFKGLKVIDISSVLAGPLTGSFFAELGAEVTKIENKNSGGDSTRQWKLPSEDPSSPYSAYYCAANFGKQIKFLDLKDENDKLILENLLKDADVVISNFQKDVAIKLEVAPDHLRKKYPHLIIAQLSAYDFDDPRPGYDLIMQAETGYISMTGTTDGTLCKMPVAMIDIIASHQMKEAILIAMLQKNKSGKGAIIHVSLYKSALSALANQASNYLMCNHVAGPLGTMHPNIAPYGDLFSSSDNQVFMLAIGSDTQFEKLWNTLSSDSGNYTTFDTNYKRLNNRVNLNKILQTIFFTFTYEFIESMLLEKNIPFCKIKNMAEVFSSKKSYEMINDELIDDSIRSKSIKSVAFEINN